MDFIPLSSKQRNIRSQSFPSVRKRNFNKMSSKASNDGQDNSDIPQKMNKRPSSESILKTRIKKKAKGKVSLPPNVM